MRISEAKKCIKELYLHTESVVALISERGIGKTSAYRQCTEELGIGYIGLYAAALEGPDFMGLPDKDREKGITRYLAPQFLPTEQAVKEGLFPERGILVIEEINRVPSDTTSVLYPLLLERRINNHSLAKGWRIGVTMNPDTMNYTVNALDDAMLDRFISIEVTADLDDYIAYSLANNPNDAVLSFLNAYPDMLLVVKGAADNTSLNKTPTPRGWTKIQEIMNNCTLDQKLLRDLVAGIVGPQSASSFFSFLKNQELKMPSTQKLLNQFEEVRPLLMEILESKRLDILSLVIKKVVLAFTLDEAQLNNMNAFVECLPDELQLFFFKYLATRRSDDFDRVTEGMASFERASDKILKMLL
ncbi:MAG: hypothetical protein N2376_13260 [Clostridia bacterium]|nr:hypothetical protein [Clostridia bacterium]